MRLDHIAYRVADRKKTAKFFQEALGYTIQTEFEIKFDDGSAAKCIALEPPEKPPAKEKLPWRCVIPYDWQEVPDPGDETRTITMSQKQADYHVPPEIFVSDGDPESIVGKWVAARNGVGGIHHLAYHVENVADIMELWKQKGYAEFTTEEPMESTEGLI